MGMLANFRKLPCRYELGGYSHAAALHQDSDLASVARGHWLRSALPES